MTLLAFAAAWLATAPPPTATPASAVLELERNSPVVRDGRLVEDVGLETLGGVFTVLLPREVGVPVEKTETFSTAADDQDQIQIRLFRGVDRVARKNTPVGWFAFNRSTAPAPTRRSAASRCAAAAQAAPKARLELVR